MPVALFDLQRRSQVLHDLRLRVYAGPLELQKQQLHTVPVRHHQSDRCRHGRYRQHSLHDLRSHERPGPSLRRLQLRQGLHHSRIADLGFHQHHGVHHGYQPNGKQRQRGVNSRRIYVSIVDSDGVRQLCCFERGKRGIVEYWVNSGSGCGSGCAEYFCGYVVIVLAVVVVCVRKQQLHQVACSTDTLEENNRKEMQEAESIEGANVTAGDELFQVQT